MTQHVSNLPTHTNGLTIGACVSVAAMMSHNGTPVPHAHTIAAERDTKRDVTITMQPHMKPLAIGWAAQDVSPQQPHLGFDWWLGAVTCTTYNPIKRLVTINMLTPTPTFNNYATLVKDNEYTNNNDDTTVVTSNCNNTSKPTCNTAPTATQTAQAAPTQWAISHHGATGDFHVKGAPAINIKPASNPITIILPVGFMVKSTHMQLWHSMVTTQHNQSPYPPRPHSFVTYLNSKKNAAGLSLI